ATFERSVNVIYNEPPVISGKTKCFFSLDEANAGAITKKALLDDLLADGSLVVTDEEDDIWYPGTLPGKLVLLDYDEKQFENLDGPAYQTLHYLIIDSLGKEDTFELQVYIIEAGEIDNGLDTENVRFIDEKNYLKNIDLFKEELSEEEIAASLTNGGLPAASIWYTNTEYAQCISDIFTNIRSSSPVNTYTYSSKDVSKLKESPALILDNN
ncbi:MAG: hypothetical protein ACI4KE_08375, partial [Anaerovoracaceae bacterium]